MKVSEVKKMKSLEDENAWLKRLVAVLSLEKIGKFQDSWRIKLYHYADFSSGFSISKSNILY